MNITHTTTKAPGQTLAAVADWNANHVQSEVGVYQLQPLFIAAVEAAAVATGNTVMRVGMCRIPFPITAAIVSIRIGVKTTNGYYKLALFSENGQTKLFEVTTPLIDTTNKTYTTAITPAVNITSGLYYFALLPISTVNAQPRQVNQHSVSSLNAPAGEPVIEGLITVTADTIPTTINPLTISEGGGCTHVFRLDA